MSENAADIQSSLERIADLLLEAHAIAIIIDDQLLRTVVASGLLHTGHRLAEVIGLTSTEAPLLSPS